MAKKSLMPKYEAPRDRLARTLGDMYSNAPDGNLDAGNAYEGSRARDVLANMLLRRDPSQMQFSESPYLPMSEMYDDKGFFTDKFAMVMDLESKAGYVGPDGMTKSGFEAIDRHFNPMPNAGPTLMGVNGPLQGAERENALVGIQLGRETRQGQLKDYMGELGLDYTDPESVPPREAQSQPEGFVTRFMQSARNVSKSVMDKFRSNAQIQAESPASDVTMSVRADLVVKRGASRSGVSAPEADGSDGMSGPEYE